MKLAFKFNTFGLLSFAVMCGLFYWLCPVPSAALWRAVIYAAFGAFAFAACFLIEKPR